MRTRWLGTLLATAAFGVAAAPSVLFQDALNQGPGKDGAPAGWKLYRTQIDGSSGTIRFEGSGKAVRLEDDGPGEIGFSREFTVKPGSWLRASLEAAVPPGAPEGETAFRLQFTFPQPRQSKAEVIAADAGQKFFITINDIQVPNGATKLIVYIYSHKSPTGTILIRNFKLEASDTPFPAPTGVRPRTAPRRLEAESAELNPQTAEIISRNNLQGGRGVALKDGQPSSTGKKDAPPDLTFRIQAPRSGRYVLRTHAATNAKGAEQMRQAGSKFASMFMKIQIDDQRPTERVVFVPWSRPDSCIQTAGKFEFSGRDQQLKLWLPEGLQLDYVELAPYVPPAVPKAAQNYKPTLTPPPTHPRLLITPATLEQVRANLEKPENLPYWNRLKTVAEKPFEFKFDPNAEVKYNTGLENAAAWKAFYYLMTGDRKIGREAVQLTCDYISHVEFGNLLDITREIGSALFSAARVYDWCYDLMSPEERNTIRKNMMRLADDMENGWPPFLQSIVNGHGNEAQVNRDLLSMAIAIYDEDPLPYQYCAYKILEELVPMRKFEYQSPRHNQGIGYGSYRFSWDMHAAWIFRRMLNRPVFDDNIKDVYKYWLYMRMPDGGMLRDGDGLVNAKYWGAPLTTFLCYTYADNPVCKGEFFRQGNLHYDPVLFLLLNNPDLKPESSLRSLPLTIDFGPVLSGMVARTGWNIGSGSSDVVAEIKGGGVHFGNHQHADAGSFQLYYRGLQAAKLGLYRFYGTPYDMNFNKRSIAQSMMLAVDPSEKFLSTPANDGGVRFNQSFPITPEEALNNPRFHNGRKISCSFGPSPMRPFYSYFSVNLKGAYSNKITDYVRSFCFLNLGNEKVPAAILIFDDMTTARAEFKKYWQLNTLNPPETTPEGAILHNSTLGLVGKVHVNMLLPRPADRKLEVLSGADANSVFGMKFTPPYSAPEAAGTRLMFSPVKPAQNDVFLTVLQTVDGDSQPLPVAYTETDGIYTVTLADRVVTLVKGTTLREKPFNVVAPAGKDQYQILLTGLKPGEWHITTPDGKALYNAQVEAGKNTLFFVATPDRYTVAPGTAPGAPALTEDPAFMPPETGTIPENAVMVNGKVVPGTLKRSSDGPLVPAEAVFRALGVETKSADGMLTVELQGRKAVFSNYSTDFTIDGINFSMRNRAERVNGVWYLPAHVVAALTHSQLNSDTINNSVAFSPAPYRRNQPVLWAESNKNANQDEIFEMLSSRPRKSTYWAGSGRDTWFKLVLSRPMKLKGIGIRWLSGSSRVANFSLECSPDGRDWHTVYKGQSSGKTEQMETYSFPPETVRQIRFNGYGNNQNDWNSIYDFKLIEE